MGEGLDIIFCWCNWFYLGPPHALHICCAVGGFDAQLDTEPLDGHHNWWVLRSSWFDSTQGKSIQGIHSREIHSRDPFKGNPFKDPRKGNPFKGKSFFDVQDLNVELDGMKNSVNLFAMSYLPRFWNCTLSGPGCAELRTMLSTNPTLTELSLNCLGLKDSGVRLVCEGLKRSGCRIQRLEMCNCLLTGVCCADLASVLSTTPSLTELALSDDALGDLGIAQLCEGLRQSQCKLQRLELDQTSLTGSCCADLASVLRTKTSLTELSLRHNALGDAGLRRLCEGLNHPGIRLQKLDLCHCSLTGACCADLAVALSETPSLIELNLGRNELGDSGLIQLCHGLERPDCRIEKLWLVSCSLSGSCGAALASLLATSQTLTTLCLAENELGDPAVMQLCEGLKEPGCKIQTLDLWLCSLSASCCPDLASAVIGSPALTELILSDNKLGDSGLQLLCDGLRNPGCKVQTLNLDTNGLTDDSIPDLCSALAANDTLQTLTLNCNHLTDASISSFIQLRKTRGTLPNIGTAGNNFTSSGREELKLLMDDSG